MADSKKAQAQEVEEKDYLAPTDLWVNANWSKVVDAGSEEAVHLLSYQGQLVAYESAVRLGLIKKDGEPGKNAPVVVVTPTK